MVNQGTRLTITLARQLGCGGSSVGQTIADRLGIRCLDREIVSRTAEQLAIDEDEMADREERCSSFWERMLRGISVGTPETPYQQAQYPSLTDKDLFVAETEIMKTIADREDCVIVGRVASHVLAPHPGLVRIFLYAPMRFRVPRIMEIFNLQDEAQARAMIQKSDESRRRFIAQMTNRAWDEAKNYHLCVDTSTLPLPEIADLIIDYAMRKSGRAAQNQ